MALEQKEVPLDLRRRAAQHLESIRGTPMAPRAEGARLGREVWPIHRPDLDDVAYYEFSVETSGGGRRLSTSAAGLSELIAAQRGSQGERAVGKGPASEAKVRPELAVPLERRASRARGFIVVTNGRHDFPVPHWSLERPPVSAQLAAAAEEGADGIERIYRLDSLAYVAEAKDGKLAARVGQTPPMMAGLPHDLVRHRDANTTLIAEARGDLKSDDTVEGVKHEPKRDGEGPPELKPVDVESWPAFRDRYRDVFGPFLDDLRRQANATWELEDAINEFGEGIHAGTTHRVALLQPEAVVELNGEGADLVRARIDEQSGAPALLIEVPPGTAIESETDLDVFIRYPDGEEERLRFFLVSPETPSNGRSISEGGR
jgi:hypothetical protein